MSPHPPRYRPVILILALVFFLLSTGCAELVQDAVLAPYTKAMQTGRMSPADYQRQRDEIYHGGY